MRRSRSLVLETLDERVVLSAIAAPTAPGSPPIIAPVSQGLVVKLSTRPARSLAAEASRW